MLDQSWHLTKHSFTKGQVMNWRVKLTISLGPLGSEITLFGPFKPETALFSRLGPMATRRTLPGQTLRLLL